MIFLSFFIGVMVGAFIIGLFAAGAYNKGWKDRGGEYDE